MAGGSETKVGKTIASKLIYIGSVLHGTLFYVSF